MPLFTVAQVLEITGGRLVSGSRTAGVRRVWTDSRTVRRGDLFVALTGEHFDGHQFVDDAIRKGAMGALVRTGAPPGRKRSAAVIEVKDPLRGYQDLAAAHRRRFRVPLVAISGSNGKTTTKELIGRILSERFPTLITKGNLNNHIGVPQTLLRLTARHRAAVLEMGISAVGEMRHLCAIAAPTHGVLTNIGPTHLATLGNLQTVAQAKGELLESLPAEGTAILNADDDFFEPLRAKVKGRVLSFGYRREADVRALDVECRGAGASRIRIAVRGRRHPFTVAFRLAGRHNVANALAATATGLSLGVGVESIRRGLARFHPIAMRSEVRRWQGATLLNDSYNANPASVRAALQWLGDMKGSGRSFAVLGDMLELGEKAEEAHRAIGRELAAGVDYLLATGSLGAEIAAGAVAAGMPATHVLVAEDHDALAEHLRRLVQRGDVVLLKGSRGARMERVLEAL